MIAHVTPTGVVYEVNVSQEEARRRMACIVGQLLPAYLRMQARGAEAIEDEVVGNHSSEQNTKSKWSATIGDHSQPLVRVYGDLPTKEKEEVNV